MKYLLSVAGWTKLEPPYSVETYTIDRLSTTYEADESSIFLLDWVLVVHISIAFRILIDHHIPSRISGRFAQSNLFIYESVLIPSY
jgi:hypothetical protein